MDNCIVAVAERSRYSLQEVVAQISAVQEIMQSIMKEGEHYGKIPGCGDKPTLLKAGAEKLGFAFRLRPDFEIEQTDFIDEHREYRIVCTLIHVVSGVVYGQGVGCCSTKEGKYKYRTGEVEFTGQPVPSEYWTNRDISLIGGKGFVPKKNPDTSKWEIARQGEKVEHNNPADYYNTCLKMAKKRAHVDAIITVTAASDIFTQDIEDMDEVRNQAATYTIEQQSEAGTPQRKQPDETQPSTEPTNEKIREMCLEITDGGEVRAAELLVSLTTFTGKDGQVVAGIKSTSLIKSQAQRNVLYGKLLKMLGEKSGAKKLSPEQQKLIDDNLPDSLLQEVIKQVGKPIEDLSAEDCEKVRSKVEELFEMGG